MDNDLFRGIPQVERVLEDPRIAPSEGHMEIWEYFGITADAIALDDAMQSEALAAGFDPRCLRRMNNGIEFASFSSTRTKDEAKSSLGLNGKIVVMFMGRLSETRLPRPTCGSPTP